MQHTEWCCTCMAWQLCVATAIATKGLPHAETFNSAKSSMLDSSTKSSMRPAQAILTRHVPLLVLAMLVDCRNVKRPLLPARACW
jgi:hypothetical protein